MRILIIEDDRDIAELIRYNLEREHFDAEVRADGREGLERALEFPPDLIVLDLMLPSLGGLAICKSLRAHPPTAEVPVLILTAKSEEADRIMGLEAGADDYLTKPFSPRELLLRIRAILKRGLPAAGAAPVSFGILTLDPQRFRLTVAGDEVRLTALEFKLLQYLVTHRGHVITRDVLLDQVWGYQAALTTRTVDTHVKRLREKLRDAGAYIETIRGVGYRCREDRP